MNECGRVLRVIVEKKKFYQIWVHFKDPFTFEMHDNLRTEPWRMNTLTFPSRNSVLMQPIIRSPAPEIPMSRSPHWRFFLTVKKSPFKIFVFVYAGIQTNTTFRHCPQTRQPYSTLMLYLLQILRIFDSSRLSETIFASNLVIPLVRRENSFSQTLLPLKLWMLKSFSGISI